VAPRAEKKVPFVDQAGNAVKPDKPNAIKLEQFVFDAVPLAATPLVYTTDRAEDFSPVKNAEGADSPATSRRDQIRRHARWLKAVGVQVPYKDDEVDAVIEISPLYAATLEQLRNRRPAIAAIKPGSNSISARTESSCYEHRGTLFSACPDWSIVGPSLRQ